MGKNDEFYLVDTEAKLKSVLFQNKDKNIICSYSGGKDSDMMLNVISKIDVDKKVQFVFFDTGLEYEATKRHIQEQIAKGYNIKIERAYRTIPLTIKSEGQPFISKYNSEMLSRLQRHIFDFQNDGKLSYPELILKYPKCVGALKWWCDFYGSEYDVTNSVGSSFNIKRNRLLKEFLIEFGLPFKVSSRCCYYAKKMTSHTFEKKNKVELILTGIRKAEGGIRSKAYKNCFVNREDTGVSLYMPLFWWSEVDVVNYLENNSVELSDCYTKYGLKRTGCAGCPFGKNMNFEREVVKKYEPNLSKAVEFLFKDSYIWTNKYREFAKLKSY